MPVEIEIFKATFGEAVGEVEAMKQGRDSPPSSSPPLPPQPPPPSPPPQPTITTTLLATPQAPMLPLLCLEDRHLPVGNLADRTMQLIKTKVLRVKTAGLWVSSEHLQRHKLNHSAYFPPRTGDSSKAK
ncbi:hypothetical protein E2C01_053467 [Portunus trituberculatus]|uniref:Uncharacterized protein n=1 Tax=Portunus trituberculatus TaxID=210409 RepID=A0A5B7GQV6_PORTR|nr:hypothetical protein [Portunus trituberculatus]